jgi:hypothetical protein
MAGAKSKTASGRTVLAIDPSEIPFANSGVDVPAIYADHIRGTFISQGVVKLILVENRADALDQEVRAVIVATIIIPQTQLRPWATFLTNLAEGAEAELAAAQAEHDAASRN